MRPWRPLSLELGHLGMAHQVHRFMGCDFNIEGRISGLKRRHKLNRCRYHGTAGMERWVGWGVIAHNLRVIARAMAH